MTIQPKATILETGTDRSCSMTLNIQYDSPLSTREIRKLGRKAENKLIRLAKKFARVAKFKSYQIFSSTHYPSDVLPVNTPPKQETREGGLDAERIERGNRIAAGAEVLKRRRQTQVHPDPMVDTHVKRAGDKPPQKGKLTMERKKGANRASKSGVRGKRNQKPKREHLGISLPGPARGNY